MHFLSDKSPRQCLTKTNRNTMRTGGRYGQGNLLFFASSSASTSTHNRDASEQNGWVEPVRAHYI